MRSYSKYFNNWIVQHWQQPKFLGWLLWPCSIIFQIIAQLRKLIYQRLAYHAKVPVIVVGNITVGGTGKTPTVIYLAKLLQQQGYKPGIVTRGYKSHACHNNTVTRVHKDGDPKTMGDEPILLAQSTNCPVVISKVRAAGVRELEDEVDIIICDDGLQHYLLARDIEIALIDGDKKFGNGFCLPMGPLREPIRRLEQVDFILENGKELKLVPDVALKGHGQKVHAVAGIGNPARFFNMLRSVGFQLVEHSFPDHYQYKESDLKFTEQLPIYMTAKDAVKCQNFGINIHIVNVQVQLPKALIEDLLALIKEKCHARSELIRHTSLPNMQG